MIRPAASVGLARASSSEFRVEPKLDLSAFADFADALQDQRVRSEQLVRRALSRVGDHYPDRFRDELNDVSRAVDGTLETLERAVEELHSQNDALFAARVELEESYIQFCNFFELAPMAYVVTAPDTRVLHANQDACALLGRRRNGLAGRLLMSCVPLEDRAAFRAALVRSTEPGMVSEWPATLLSINGEARIHCRMRVRAVAAPGAGSSRALYWNITEETDEDLF
jgi:PAS domain-containing protein